MRFRFDGYPEFHPNIHLVRAGMSVAANKLPSISEYSGSLLEAIYAEYRAGSTIIFQFLHERWAPLQNFCDSRRQQFSTPTLTNVYLTPQNAQGLKTHYDTHDVFVLQIAGSKHWRIYGATEMLPVKHEPYTSQAQPSDAPEQEFELEAGDVLYLPRGRFHDAAAGSKTSVHITIGIMALTWTVLIERAVKNLAAGRACPSAMQPVQ